MKRSFTLRLIVVALVLMMIGVTGAIKSYSSLLFTYFGKYAEKVAMQQRMQPSQPARYVMYEQVTVTTAPTIRIIASGGKVSVNESTTNQIQLLFYAPYKPNDDTLPLIQREGNNYVVNTADIWHTLSGNESHPVLDIEIQVPHGTSLVISNTIGDISLAGVLDTVEITATLGTVAVHSPDISQLILTNTVGGDVTGLAPKSTRINVNDGTVSLHVTQAGTQQIHVTTGAINLAVDMSLLVATTHRIEHGTFHSSILNSPSEKADVNMQLTVGTGTIDLIP